MSENKYNIFPVPDHLRANVITKKKQKKYEKYPAKLYKKCLDEIGKGDFPCQVTIELNNDVDIIKFPHYVRPSCSKPEDYRLTDEISNILKALNDAGYNASISSSYINSYDATYYINISNPLINK